MAESNPTAFLDQLVATLNEVRARTHTRTLDAP